MTAVVGSLVVAGVVRPGLVVAESVPDQGQPLFGSGPRPSRVTDPGPASAVGELEVLDLGQFLTPRAAHLSLPPAGPAWWIRRPTAGALGWAGLDAGAGGSGIQARVRVPRSGDRPVTCPVSEDLHRGRDAAVAVGVGRLG